jgi:DNA-binding transcriptional ArsR family regulator
MGNLTCGDRANSLPVTPATVSHHLKVLKQVELIAGLEALQTANRCAGKSISGRNQKQTSGYSSVAEQTLQATRPYP